MSVRKRLTSEAGVGFFTLLHPRDEFFIWNRTPLTPQSSANR